MDLKVCTALGIHTYKKGHNTQVIKCSPWGTKEVAGAREAPAPSQPMEAPVAQSPTSPIPPNTEHIKYCVICIPLGKICPNEYPMSSDWDENLEEEERKNQEIEDQKGG